MGRAGSQKGHGEWWIGQIHITIILLSTEGNSGQFESTIKGPIHSPSAQPWNQLGVELHTQTLLWTSPRATQLTAGPSQECVYPSEPSCTDTVQSQGERGAGLARCTLLAQPDLVPRADAPCNSPSLMYSSEEGSTFSVTKHPVALASGSLETPCLVPGWDTEVLGDLPQDVADTFTLEHALSMRLTYTLK